jgi:ketol-acid reductoisomerase
MPTVYYDADADIGLLQRRRVAIVGYGIQGRAHAANLRDSGCEVRVGARPDGHSWRQARAEGFEVQPVAEVSDWADVISLLLPDQHHKHVFEEAINPSLSGGEMVLVAHGFSVIYGQIRPPDDVDVALVAPVGPGRSLRRLFLAGMGIPAVMAVDRNITGQAEALALAYARALGCTRAGVIGSTFREETETDLFGEQAVLCGGLSALIKAGFDTLVEAGYQPELAYFECLHQVKLIADLIYEGGLASMYARISDTAEYGAYVSGPRVIDNHVRGSMHAVLEDIQDGTFARAWMAEAESGGTNMTVFRARERQLLIEQVGAELRAMMPWLGLTASSEEEQSDEELYAPRSSR